MLNLSAVWGQVKTNSRTKQVRVSGKRGRKSAKPSDDAPNEGNWSELRSGGFVPKITKIIVNENRDREFASPGRSSYGSTITEPPTKIQKTTLLSIKPEPVDNLIKQDPPENTTKTPHKKTTHVDTNTTSIDQQQQQITKPIFPVLKLSGDTEIPGMNTNIPYDRLNETNLILSKDPQIVKPIGSNSLAEKLTEEQKITKVPFPIGRSTNTVLGFSPPDSASRSMLQQWSTKKNPTGEPSTRRKKKTEPESPAHGDNPKTTKQISDYSPWKPTSTEPHPLENCTLYEAIVGLSRDEMMSSPASEIPKTFCQSSISDHIKTMLHPYQSSAVQYAAECGKMMKYWDSLIKGAVLENPYQAGKDKYQMPVVGVSHEIALLSKPYGKIPECIKGNACMMLVLPRDDEFPPYVGMTFVTKEQLELVENGTWTEDDIHQGLIQKGLCYLCLCVSLGVAILRNNVRYSFSSHVAAQSPTLGHSSPLQVKIAQPFKIKLNCVDGFTNAAVGRFTSDDTSMGSEPFRYIDLAQFVPSIRTVELATFTESRTRSAKQIIVPTFRPVDSLVFDPCKTYTTEFQPVAPKYVRCESPVSHHHQPHQINTVVNYEYLLRMHLRDERKIVIPSIVEMGGDPKVIFSFHGEENFETWRQRGVPCRPKTLEGYSALTKTYIEKNIGYVLLEGRPFDYIFSPIETTVGHLRLLLKLFGFLRPDFPECQGISAIHYPAWRICKSLEVIPEADLDMGREYWHALHLRMNVGLLMVSICSRKHKGDKKQAINDHLKSFLLSHRALYEFYLKNGESPHFFVGDQVFSRVPVDRTIPVCLDTRGYHMIHEYRPVIRILSEPMPTHLHVDDLPFVTQPDLSQHKRPTPSQKILEFLGGQFPDSNKSSYEATTKLGLTVGSFPIFDRLGRLFGKLSRDTAIVIFSDFEVTRQKLVINHPETHFATTKRPPDPPGATLEDLFQYVENYHTSPPQCSPPCYLSRNINELMSILNNFEFWFPFPEEYRSDLSQTNACDCQHSSVLISLLIRINTALEFSRQVENYASSLRSRTCDELKHIFPVLQRDPQIFLDISKKSVEELEELQYNLKLFANTHLELVHAIHTHRVYTDKDLTTVTPITESHDVIKRGGSILEMCYPHDAAYLCEDDLPNVCHLNTILRSVMSELQSSKIVKMDWVEVCCRPFLVKPHDKKYPSNSAIITPGGEYDPAFGNEAFLKLVVFVGLSGLYRHSRISLGYDQTVELYGFTQIHSNTPEFERFVHERPLLVKTLICEFHVWLTTSLNVVGNQVLESEFRSWKKYTESCLSLADTIREKYKASARTSDDPKKNFGKRNCFAEIENFATMSYNKKLFICKKPGKNFLRFMTQIITWLENRIQKDTIAFISQSIDHQSLESIKNQSYSEHAAEPTVKIGLHADSISLEDKQILQGYVSSLVPGSNIDLNDLYSLRDSHQLGMFDVDSMEILSDCFRHYSSDKATQSSMEQLILKLSPRYYDRVCYFFHASSSHYSVAITPLSHDMAIQQAIAVWYKFHDREGEVKLDYVPGTAHTLVKSPCCDQINTHTAQSGNFRKSAVTRIGSAQIALDPFLKIVTCNRKLGAPSSNTTTNNTSANVSKISQVVHEDSDAKTQNHLQELGMNLNLSVPPKRKGPSFLKGKSANLLKILDIRSLGLKVFATLGNSNKRRFYESCGSVSVCRFPGIGYIIQNQSKKDGSVQSFVICPRCGTNSIFSFIFYGINGFTCYVCDVAERKKLENEPCAICKRG